MSSADWFARKLGVPQPQQPYQQPQQPQHAAPPPAQYAPPPQPQYPPYQQTAPQAPVCPSCRSTNYGGPAGYKPRCYDCGYPIEQSGSGLGRGIVGGNASGPAQPSRQVTPGTFNGTTPVIGADGGFVG